jgi:hypothetical protein
MTQGIWQYLNCAVQNASQTMLKNKKTKNLDAVAAAKSSILSRHNAAA